MKTLFSISAFLISAFVATDANAQDVYNFYFQKSQNAKEMVQVKNVDPPAATSKSKSSSDVDAIDLDSDEPPLAKDPLSANTSTAKPSDAKPDASLSTVAIGSAPAKDVTKNFWRVGLGQGSFTDHANQIRDGLSLKVEAGLSRYFGVDAQIIGGKVRLTDEVRSPRTRYAGALGLRVTPIHMNVFGWDLLEFSAMAGAMTATGRDSDTTNDFRIAAYLGGQMTLNFSERVALMLDGKFEDGGTGFGQTTATLAYRF